MEFIVNRTDPLRDKHNSQAPAVIKNYPFEGDGNPQTLSQLISRIRRMLREKARGAMTSPPCGKGGCRRADNLALPRSINIPTRIPLDLSSIVCT